MSSEQQTIIQFLHLEKVHSTQIPRRLAAQYASQWPVSRDEVPQRVHPVISAAKFMPTVIWGVNSFHLLDLMPSQCRFNAQYFVEHVMAPLVQAVDPQGRTRYIPRVNVHLDACHVHFPKVPEQFFIENQLLHVPRPSYSPDLALSDFWLFGNIKTGLASRSLAGPEELLEVFESFWREFLPRN
jgi:hypothetical protein